jgi:hypothetical protein
VIASRAVRQTRELVEIGAEDAHGEVRRGIPQALVDPHPERRREALENGVLAQEDRCADQAPPRLLDACAGGEDPRPSLSGECERPLQREREILAGRIPRRDQG